MKSTVLTALALLLTASAQVALAPRMEVLGARPDLLLVAITLLSMNRSSDAAAVIGFFAGLLHGGIANTKMAAFIMSRLLGGIAASIVGRTTVTATPLTVMASSVATTGVASIAYLLVGTPRDMLAWALGALGALVYNTALVLVVFWLLGRRRGRT